MSTKPVSIQKACIEPTEPPVPPSCDAPDFVNLCNLDELAQAIADAIPQENDIVFPACDSADPDAQPFFVKYTRDEDTNQIVYSLVLDGAIISPTAFTVCPETKTYETPYCIDGVQAGVLLTCYKLGGTPVVIFIDNNGVSSSNIPTGAMPCESNSCWEFAGECRCYGAGGGDAAYDIDDNETDGTFSIGGTGATLIKWDVDSPASESDGLAEFTLAIVDCINSGETAQLTITDQDGNAFSFPANTVNTSGNSDGSGFWLFEGPGAPASGAGKMFNAVLTCSASASGRACKEKDCSTGLYRWYDSENDVILSEEQINSLHDCPLPDTCEQDTNEAVICAAEASTTISGTTVSVDDQILQILVVDCNSAVVSSAMYHIPSGEQIEGPILTDQCDPQPDLETIRDCLIDEAGVQWTQLGIVDPSTPESATPIYYDQDLQGGVPSGDSSEWTPCDGAFVDYVDTKLCEIDARFLLLIDSEGAFARYSFYTKSWENVSTLSVSSSGGSADVENFLLYNFVFPDQMTVIDVNSDIQLPSITLVDGVVNPNATTNPKTFSAAAFREANGRLYAWDTAGVDAGLYSVDVNTGVIDFVTAVTGVSGTGTSIMIDNQSDTLYINGTTLSYQVDWTTGVSTLWGNPPIRPNGATFDTSGNAYVTEGSNTYYLPTGADANDTSAWVQIIDDWAPGANSLAYYEVLAPSPSCFFRRYGIKPDGTREFIGDFNIIDNSPRTVVGDVDCCECTCGGGSSEYGGPTAEDIAEAINGPDVSTTFSSELFNSAFVVPTVPTGTREMVVFNNSGAWIEIETSVGTQIVPPNGTAQWCVNDYEPDLGINSVSVLSGTFTTGENWAINYRMV